MRTLPKCAAICSLSIAALASADVYVFDNALSYADFCDASSIVRQPQTLSTSAGSYAFITGGSGDYSWSLGAANGVYLDGAGMARTQVNSDKLSLNFSSSNVFSVGGFFYNVDSSGGTRAGSMKIRLSDGTTFVRTVSNTTTFSGFVSDGASIASVEVSHAGSLGSQYFVATSGFNIGVVPAPGALALVGLAGVLSRRRRA
jgi:uncharacterized protein (TIGR03382 family)